MKKQKTRVLFLVTIVLVVFIVPTTIQVSAEWSASTKDVDEFSYSTDGNSKWFEDNGQHSGYKTWSAQVKGGIWNWGKVNVYLTSARIESDDWAGIYDIDMKTYFRGHIVIRHDNLNVYLKIVYKLKRGGVTVSTTTEYYDDAADWYGSTITKIMHVELAKNTKYYLYIHYKYYCGTALNENKVDFWLA